MAGFIRNYIKIRNSKSFYFRLSYILIFVILATYFVWCNFQKIHLNIDHHIFTYTNKGTIQSEIDIENNAELGINYTLKANKDEEPYAGIAFLLKEAERRKFGLFDEIIVEIASLEDKIIPIIFSEEISSYSDTENEIKERVWTYDLNIKAGRQIYKIPLNSFKTIFWWFKEHKTSIGKLPEYCPERVKYIAIQNDRLQEYGIQDKFWVTEFSLNRNFNLFWFILPCLLAILFESITYFLNQKTRKIEFSPLSLQPKKLDNEWDIIKSSIANNYQNEEFKLDFLQNICGIHKSKISKLIKKHLNLSFKQYLNQIRIYEASRLLKSTELNISEIAYKVGFSNISHFNRVFKEINHCSPSEYRTFATS